MQRLRWVILLSPLLVSACGGLGSSSYGCPGMPEGVQCMSTREVYARTDNRDHLEPEKKENTEGTEAPARVISPAPHVPAPDLTDGRVALRTPAKVMRVYVAPWEDNNGDLHMSGMVFTEVIPRRWQVGLQAEADNTLFQPLRTGALFNADDPSKIVKAEERDAADRGKQDKKRDKTRSKADGKD